MKIDNIDKFGNCVFCHRNLIKNIVLNGKIEGVFDADAASSFFKMTNGSILVVPICKPCKATVDLTDSEIQTQIMQEVQNGWDLELNHITENPDKFAQFTDKKKQDLKDYYATCEITNYEPNHEMS